MNSTTHESRFVPKPAPGPDGKVQAEAQRAYEVALHNMTVEARKAAKQARKAKRK